MKKNIITSALIILVLIIILSSCTNQSSNETPKVDQTEGIINNVKECEIELINILSQVDLVPYYKKQINEKKKKEEEKKEKEKTTGTEKKEGGSEQKSDEFKPKPITNNDVLLLELLEKEQSNKMKLEKKKEIPEDIVFVWHEISESIDNMHVNWDDLKAKLEKSKVSPKAISGFDDSLNSLTISSNENKYLETLINTNTASSYLPQFARDLKKSNLASIYAVKYFIRDMVLNAARNDYTSINKNMNTIKSEQKRLSAELKKKKDEELANRLELSISNLEDAVLLKDINVIKIKASIVIQNINSAQEKLST